MSFIIDGKRFVKDVDTRVYRAHGLGRTRRESADCNSREHLGRGLGCFTQNYFYPKLLLPKIGFTQNCFYPKSGLPKIGLIMRTLLPGGGAD